MKNILITGASGDIGSEIARKFASKDNRLILVYNNSKKKIDYLLDELMEKCEISSYKCDLTDDELISAMIEDIISKYKHIDCLINCAGVSQIKQIQDVTLDDYNFLFDNNVKSTILLTKYVSKHMISAKYGKIINISSIWGNVGASMESVYSATKGAINSFTLSLAKELGYSNITVNAICPGLIEGKMNSFLTDEEKKTLIDNTPLGRTGQGSDIANICEFLCSEKADFITGQIITVDGGLTL